MYVTRPLSLYRKSPIALEDEPPAEGPYSGYIVIADEEAEEQDTFCFGAYKKKGVEKLPFPQDKMLNVVHSSEVEETMSNRVWFIPVLDHPLSSNQYYVIRAKGRYKGLACTSSREIDNKLCCFFSDGGDVKPKPFDHRNVYQQFKIHRHHRHSFFAKSTATDSTPPKFLRRNGWELRISRSYRLQLNQALGLNSSLRKSLPSFDFPMFNKKSPSVVVGQWYCPFIFVREETRLQRQMKKSLFYTMTLEQWWQQIHTCDRDKDKQRVVNIDKMVQREFISVKGMLAARDHKIGHGGFWWFRTLSRNDGRKGSNIGLSLAVTEKMKWLQGGGWSNGEDSEVRVAREEEMNEDSEWRRYGCYILVESFQLRNMDGTLVLRCDFRHTHKIRSKWE